MRYLYKFQYGNSTNLVDTIVGIIFVDLIFVGHIFGKIHHKTVANSFWEGELYNELLQNNISHIWSFTSKKREDRLFGTKDIE